MAPRKVSLTCLDITVRLRTTFPLHGLNKPQCRAAHGPKNLCQVIHHSRYLAFMEVLFSLFYTEGTQGSRRERDLLQHNTIIWTIIQGSCNQWMLLREGQDPSLSPLSLSFFFSRSMKSHKVPSQSPITCGPVIMSFIIFLS